MALPNIMRRLFRSDGYGPLLKPEIIPFAVSLASAAADAAASTEWVKDLAAAPVYVDAANGADSNDGFTSATAVKTISKGIEILNSILVSSGMKTRLYVAGGTYTGDVLIQNLSTQIILQGNVTINGSVAIKHNSDITISNETSGSLSIISSGVSGLETSLHSYVNVLCDISVTTSNANNCIICSTYSYLRLFETLTISGSSITSGALTITRTSCVTVYKTVSISGSSILKGVDSYERGLAYFAAGLTIASGSISSICVRADGCSQIVINGNSTLIGSTGLRATALSQITLVGFSALALTRTGSSNLVEALDHSRVSIGGNSGSSATINLGNSTTGDCFHIVHHSYLYFYASSAAFSGKNATTMHCGGKSLAEFPNTISVSGSVTGRRYYASLNSVIYVANGGTNRIPGSTAGTVESGNYSFYG